VRALPLALLGAVTLAACGGGTERAARPAAGLPGRDRDPGGARGLPTQGLVAARRQGVVLAGLDGRALGHLNGFEVDVLAEQGRFDRVVYLRGPAGREWSVGPAGIRPASRPGVVPFPPGYDGCDPVAPRYVVCGRPAPAQTSRVARREAGGRLRPVVGPAMRTAHGVVGRWIGVHPSPDGRTLLLQWSGECEIPVAYVAASSGSGLRPVDRSATTTSVALGWTADGRALVSVAQGDCGLRAHAVTYAVDVAGGARTAIVRGETFLWGDASAGAAAGP
jgi:hypothetical protein